MAIQNAGVLEITRQYPLMILSIGFPRFIPASEPNKNPISPDKTHAMIIRNKEFPSFTAITVVTFWR